MANVDVKLGIKHILERMEQAYSRRNPVRLAIYSHGNHGLDVFISFSKLLRPSQSLLLWAKRNQLNWLSMPIQLVSGILVKIMSRNCGRKVPMNWLTNIVPKFAGISLVICSLAQWTRSAVVSSSLNCWIIIELTLNCILFQLLKVPRLEMIETIDSIKLADEVNKKFSNTPRTEPLKVLVQVNTSQEDGKCLQTLIHNDNSTELLCRHFRIQRKVASNQTPSTNCISISR